MAGSCDKDGRCSVRCGSGTSRACSKCGKRRSRTSRRRADVRRKWRNSPRSSRDAYEDRTARLPPQPRLRLRLRWLQKREEETHARLGKRNELCACDSRRARFRTPRSPHGWHLRRFQKAGAHSRDTPSKLMPRPSREYPTNSRNLSCRMLCVARCVHSRRSRSRRRDVGMNFPCKIEVQTCSMRSPTLLCHAASYHFGLIKVMTTTPRRWQ
mmetsp:Transcript_4832/g.11965  ORF Transcript_4832/g.11965 Transcript_4832/m.11965 type:complete len:212 (+) Transcript_4832:1-636(+)